MLPSMIHHKKISKKVITGNNNSNLKKPKLNESFNHTRKNNQSGINNLNKSKINESFNQVKKMNQSDISNLNKSVIINSNISNINKLKKQNTTYTKKNIITDSNLNKKIHVNVKKAELRNNKFEEKKTQKSNETKFSIIPEKTKKFLYLSNNSFSIISEKDNIYVIIRDINMSIINNKENNKNNKNNKTSFLTQDTSVHFSILSQSNELNVSNVSNDDIKLPETPKGLNDFSLNCNMNFLIQCFYHMKSLRKNFMDPTLYSSENQKVCHSLSDIMHKLTYGEEESYSPEKFKEVLGEINPAFAGEKLADVCDVYRTFIDSVIEEIPFDCPENEDYNDEKKKNYDEAKKYIDFKNPINKTLNYFYETIYQCPKNALCYSIQNDTAIIFDLFKISQNTKGKFDLYKCFDYNFRTIDKNNFYCSKCQCQHTNKSQDKLLSLPKVLTIILNRGKGKKYKENVEFYEKINIQKYVDDTFIEVEQRKFNYKLIGVSSYLELADEKGHYMAYCYREDKKKYYCFNDTSANPVEFSQIKSDGEPSILFYEQIEEDNNNNDELM